MTHYHTVEEKLTNVRKIPCPLCEGRGHWHFMRWYDRVSGKTGNSRLKAYTFDIPCYLCKGRGKVKMNLNCDPGRAQEGLVSE